MQNGFRFREWKVYKDSLAFRTSVNKIVSKFPKNEMFALTDQTKRALNSIILNLAEGSNKNTDKDTRVYVNRSQGSLDEVIACMDCALDDRYIDAKEHEQVLRDAEGLAKQLKSFSVYLSKTNGTQKTP